MHSATRPPYKSTTRSSIINTVRNLPGSNGEPIRPVKLAHVVLRVTNLQSARAWYLSVLEARPSFENAMLCFLTYDDEHHRIGLISRPELEAPSGSLNGLEHIAFTYGSLGELLATYQRLEALGIVPFWTINHGPTISFYYRDPDGNQVELQHDVFANGAEVDAFFASGAYEENFIGVNFDPAQMLERYKSGLPVSEITARPKLVPGQSPWDMIPA